jgi:hypothetical protein
MPALYVTTGLTAGDEISSTYEGRHITIEENLLTHPYHADGLVDKGDPVLIKGTDGLGMIVGIAFTSAVAATDLIAIDTEGIWALNVMGAISDQTADGLAKALTAGNAVYMKIAAGTVGAPYMLSAEDDPSHFVPFGYLLGDVSASTTSPTLVAVKVHWDPYAALRHINVGAGYTAPTTDSLLLDPTSANRKTQWCRIAASPSRIMVAGEMVQGLNIRMSNHLVSTGGTLSGAEIAVHSPGVGSVLDGMRTLYLSATNTSAGVHGSIMALAIAMGGAGGAATYRTAIQIMADGTAGTLESWFQTEIARPCGLKAQVQSLNQNSTHKIPINIDGVIYGIPVVAWA